MVYALLGEEEPSADSENMQVLGENFSFFFSSKQLMHALDELNFFY